MPVLRALIANSTACRRSFPIFLTVALVLALTFGSHPVRSQAPAETTLSASAADQIAALEEEKAGRTPAQLRIDSKLLCAERMALGQPIARGITHLRSTTAVDASGMALVDIDAEASDALLSQITALGGQIVKAVPQLHSVRARIPIRQVEAVASMPGVKWIRPGARARLHGRIPASTPLTVSSLFPASLLNPSIPLLNRPSTSRIARALSEVAARQDAGTSTFASTRAAATGFIDEGDITEGVNLASADFNVTGAGVKVGVVSDSVDYLTQMQSDGYVGNVTVLPGLSGLNEGNTGEGTALCVIIHALAPGASLYFATGATSPAEFASSIVALQQAGCSVIVDDLGYPGEAPFQDDVIAQAVNTVTAAGVVYVSAAGNSGNEDAGTSSAWEGNFVSAGAANSTLLEPGTLHSFGKTNYDTIVTNSIAYPGALQPELYWSDPLGASSNDYDLFILDPTGSYVVADSNNSQTGTQDPYETVDTLSTNTGADGDVGDRIVVVLYSGVARYLRVDLWDCGLSASTASNIWGHPCAANAFAIAAVDAQGPYPNEFTGGPGTSVEPFSVDGPRRVFYNANGTAITPGNVSSTGGAIRETPQLSAADDVTSPVPNFTPFFGTSAASGHAAGIAALLLSYRPSLTAAQVRSTMENSAMDIMATGFDRDSGYGLMMAVPLLQNAPSGTTTAQTPSITLTSSANPSLLGQVVTFTARLAAVAPATGTPTGTVTFLDEATTPAAQLGTATLSSGVAALSTSALSAGSHSITASYSGDINFTSASTAVLAQVVNEGTTTNPGAPWQAVDIAVGSDNSPRVLWDNPDGRATFWSVNPSTMGYTNGPIYGPYSGYTAQDLACGSDGLTRALWNNANGIDSFWMLDSTNTETGFTIFGPFSQWTATDVAAGNDGNGRILWTNSDGEMVVWSATPAGVPVNNQTFYGPYLGYNATNIACGSDGLTRVLWKKSDGTAVLWLMNANNSEVNTFVLGQFAGWTAVDVSVGSDNLARILWTCTDGRMVVWTVDNSGNATNNAAIYGPYPGYTANRIGCSPQGQTWVLWNRADGAAVLWDMNENNTFQTSELYGPYY